MEAIQLLQCITIEKQYNQINALRWNRESQMGGELFSRCVIEIYVNYEPYFVEGVTNSKIFANLLVIFYALLASYVSVNSKS